MPSRKGRLTRTRKNKGNPLILKNYWKKRKEEGLTFHKKKIENVPSTSDTQIENVQDPSTESVQQVNEDIYDSSPLSPLHTECVSDINTNEDSFQLSGRRIVDISYFMNSILSIGTHVPFSCTIADMYPISEARNGFVSIIKLKCRICGLIKQIKTDDTSEKNANINADMVSGMISIGGGYSQLKKLCTAINMPNLANNTWVKYREEKATIARFNGELNHRSILCIIIAADHEADHE
ncbi:mucin-5AC-like [Vespula squamosa]|uniref:Mucin-5AC-like n=1 Tax=Vespula squamosa TaxID=30214 RepID=A0ABD2BT64_VESSQ